MYSTTFNLDMFVYGADWIAREKRHEKLTVFHVLRAVFDRTLGQEALTKVKLDERPEEDKKLKDGMVTKLDEFLSKLNQVPVGEYYSLAKDDLNGLTGPRDETFNPLVML